jgi:hypothetical protein
MQRFIHDENIRRFKQLLERTTDEVERQRILRLLAEEDAKVGPDEATEHKRST